MIWTFQLRNLLRSRLCLHVVPGLQDWGRQELWEKVHRQLVTDKTTLFPTRKNAVRVTESWILEVKGLSEVNLPGFGVRRSKF